MNAIMFIVLSYFNPPPQVRLGKVKIGYDSMNTIMFISIIT